MAKVAINRTNRDNDWPFCSGAFFGGFDVLDSDVKMATPEKALLDVLYLSATRNRRFARLPEIELPQTFDQRSARRWISRITSPPLARVVRSRYAALVAALGRRR